MVTQEALIPSGSKGGFLLRLFHSKVPPQVRPFREHHHTAFEIAVFLSGQGIYTLRDRSYDIQPGDVFLFSSNEVHSITRIDEGEDMELMNIHFEPRFIWSTHSDLFDAKYLKIFLDRSERFENRLDRDNPATGEIRQMMLALEREFQRREAEYALMVKIQLLQILVTMIRSYDYVAQDKGEGFYAVQGSLARLEEAMSYMDVHFCGDITLEELANIAHMSRSYFSTLFKRFNGISPWEYITSRRIELAKRYLRSSDCTMLEIATSCGYNNTVNFNRAFRQTTGRTPSEYRAGGQTVE